MRPERSLSPLIYPCRAGSPPLRRRLPMQGHDGRDPKPTSYRGILLYLCQGPKANGGHARTNSAQEFGRTHHRLFRNGRRGPNFDSRLTPGLRCICPDRVCSGGSLPSPAPLLQAIPKERMGASSRVSDGPCRRNIMCRPRPVSPVAMATSTFLPRDVAYRQALPAECLMGCSICWGHEAMKVNMATARGLLAQGQKIQ